MSNRSNESIGSNVFVASNWSERSNGSNGSIESNVLVEANGQLGLGGITPMVT